MRLSKDELLLQEELDSALEVKEKTNSNNIEINISINNYYSKFGGIVSLLREELNIICIKYNMFFNCNNLLEQIYHLKDKTYLATIGNVKAREKGLKEENDIKNYIKEYVNTQYYNNNIKITLRPNYE